MKKLLFLAVVLSLSAGMGHACSLPQLGVGMSHRQLVDEAEGIYLVELERTEVKGGEPTTCYDLGEQSSFPCVTLKSYIYHLKTVEILRGADETFAPFYSHSSEHYGNDFNLHRDKKFWKRGEGRSVWAGCGPDHTFRDGEQYLYFPDLLGSMKSAEIIRSPDDRWLQYVRKRVAKSRVASNNE